MTPRHGLAAALLALCFAIGLAAQAADPKPWLGVSLRGDSEAQSTGVAIQAVADGSPAAEAGINPGDTLLAVDGEAATTAKGVAERIGGMAPGTVVKLRVMHEGKASDIEVTLATRPAAQ
jgi:S1-C subfamily serine protease